jgi:tetratricopeptide (TPR) repeat protein
MRALHFNRSAYFLGFAAAILLAPGISTAQNAAMGSESGPGKSMQQNGVKDAGVPPAKKEKINKAEEAAYKAILAAQTSDPATKIQLGEDFATKFPNSRYLPGIYGILTGSYFATGNMEKMFSTGDKAIQLDPQNVDVMSLLAMAIPRRAKATTPEGAQQLQEAETYAHRTIDIIPTLEKPATVDDAVFEKEKNDKLALAHSGLGLIDIQHSKFEDARTELTQAVQLASTPDPVDYFLLGNADAKASYLNGAIAAYEKCAATGPLAAQCRARADAVKKDLGTSLSKD